MSATTNRRRSPRLLTREESRERLSNNLSRLLADRKLSPREFSRETGVPYKSVYRAVHGHVDPAVSLVINIAAALGTTVEGLLAPTRKKRAKVD